MMEAPDYLQAIAGCRAWMVAPNLWSQMGGILWATAQVEPWKTGEDIVAHCHVNPDHVPPVEDCACGIYAYYHPLALLWHRQSFEDSIHVTGVVSGWGDVLLHESGFRAQCARVEAIFDHHLMPHVELPITKEEIAEAYGAEVIAPTEYEEFCQSRDLVIIDESAL